MLSVNSTISSLRPALQSCLREEQSFTLPSSLALLVTLFYYQLEMKETIEGTMSNTPASCNLDRKVHFVTGFLNIHKDTIAILYLIYATVERARKI